MKRSDDRILTTHVGSLVRPPELIDLVRAGAEGNLRGSGVVAAATADVVARQAAAGVDVVSDGEFGKPNFAGYVSDRLTGFETRPPDPGQSAIGNWGRDRKAFRDFYEQDSSAQAGGGGGASMVCTGPISYVGQDAVQADIDNFKAALQGAAVEEAFIPAVAPGTVEGQRRNDYYGTVEEYLGALADAMHEEYKAIIDAGFILQIDDPRIVVHYDLIDPAPTPEEFRKIAALRVEATNRAIGDLPADRIRYHLCWGSWHGPHTTDFPLSEIVSLVLQVRAGAYSVEAANPPARARVADVGARGVARREAAHPGRGHAHHEHRRAPGADRVANHELRPSRGTRERDREHRLRLLSGRDEPKGASVHHVGEARVPSRRRPARERAPLELALREWATGEFASRYEPIPPYSASMRVSSSFPCWL